MPANSDLRNSTKGRLRYAKQFDIARLQLDLNQLSPPPLSRPHTESESSKLNLSFGLNAADFEEIDDGDTNNSGNDFNINALPYDTKFEEPNESTESGIPEDMRLTRKLRFSDVHETTHSKPGSSENNGRQNVTNMSTHSSPEKQYFLERSPSSLSPQLGSTVCDIEKVERLWDSLFQLAFLERQAQFEDHERALSFLMQTKWDEIKARLEQQVARQQSMLEQRQKQGQEEANKRLQQLKEDHQKHHKKIDIKHQEIERHRKILEENEKKRQEEKVKRLKEIFEKVEENRNTFVQLHDGYPHKARLPEVMDKFRSTLDRVRDGLSLQVTAAEANPHSVTDEQIAYFGDHQEKSGQAVGILKKQMAEADSRVKAEEEQRVKNEQKKEEEKRKLDAAKRLEDEAASDCRIQALKYVIEEQKDKAEKLAAVENSVKNFVQNAEMKKHRFDLQRAVNTPINAISGVDSTHLRDKIQRLQALLSGHTVEVTNKKVSAMTPEGMTFCQNLVAKMLVKKGEEQVTSKHESAFAIGAVVVNLWCDFPIVGDLFLGHLQALCPYVLPFYSTMHEGQSSADYHRSLGYKVNEDDNSIEEQDKFLKRMSGLMRLYCACLVSTPPRVQGTPHPHGIEHAWSWLARTMNLEPHPDVTAAMIHDVLSVTGYSLFKEYRVQFAKLLYLLYKTYLPKLKSVSVTNATVGRLELFLETALKTGTVPQPEGLLPPSFWYS